MSSGSEVTLRTCDSQWNLPKRIRKGGGQGSIVLFDRAAENRAYDSIYQL